MLMFFYVNVYQRVWDLGIEKDVCYGEVNKGWDNRFFLVASSQFPADFPGNPSIVMFGD